MSEIVALHDKAIVGLRSDPKLWIATGRSRFERKWKNQEVRWSVLLKRLQTPARSQESLREFLSWAKADQDRAKDAGGFVGGVLKGGIRKADTVESRSLISFDLDHAPKDFVERMRDRQPAAWAIYSTRKHRPEAPRLRMLIPLARSVTPEEYEAVSRKLAEEIGLEYFDATTFEPSRLMYWPTCSYDSQYVFEYHDGDLLDPDAYLAKYPDWHDTTQWPVCPGEIRKEKHGRRQENPTKKTGIVGTFCRTYTVPEAIDRFLPDVYKPTERASRYTYAQGTTYGGLVVYDDGLFCYSHHSTDPAHGMDLNAFDLVRIHLFGDQDDGVKDDTPPAKCPSWKAMQDLVDRDDKCKLTVFHERDTSVAVMKKDADEEESPQDDSWKASIKARSKKDDSGAEPTVRNLKLIMEQDPELQGIRYNEFSQHIEISSPCPWENGCGWWKNSDDAGLYTYLSLHYGDFKRQDIQDVLIQTALGRRFHPVRDYLDGLPAWDGVERAERIFVKYLKAEDSLYVRSVTRKWLLGAVTRIFRPGVKFDWCLTLTGDQGIGKSTIVSKLGGPWVSDSLSFDDMRDEKTAGEKLHGEWILEIGEMKGLRKMDVESVKSFLSRTVDKYRPAYGKQVEAYKRGCVFIGTGNNVDFLRDPTGNRRFWPVHCRRRPGDPDPGAWDITDEETGQIWAEVLTWYRAGEGLRLSREVSRLAEIGQEEATEQDDRAGVVELYLEELLPEGWDTMDLPARRIWLADSGRHEPGTVRRTEVTVAEIWCECFGKNLADKRRSDSDDIVRMLRQLGWECDGSTRRLLIYGKQKVFCKIKK